MSDQQTQAVEKPENGKGDQTPNPLQTEATQTRTTTGNGDQTTQPTDQQKPAPEFQLVDPATVRRLDDEAIKKLSKEMHDAVHEEGFLGRDTPDVGKILRNLELLSPADRKALEAAYDGNEPGKFRRELKDKLDGVDFRKAEAMLNRTGEGTNDAGAVVVALERMKGDSGRGNRELRDVLMAMTPEQIATMRKEFADKYGKEFGGKSIDQVIREAKGLQKETAAGLDLLMKGVSGPKGEGRTKDDIVQLAKIAMDAKNKDMFGQAVNGDMPAAKAAREALKQDGDFMKKFNDRWKNDRTANDFLNEGRISLATIAEKNAPDWWFDNPKNTTLALENASAKERADFARGRELAMGGAAGPDPVEDARVKAYYEKIHKAFKDSGGGSNDNERDRQVIIWEDRLLHPPKGSVLGQMAETHSNQHAIGGFGLFGWGGGHDKQDLFSKVEGLSEADWKLLNAEFKPPNNGGKFMQEIREGLKSFTDQGERDRILKMLEDKARSGSYEESKRVGRRGVIELLGDNKSGLFSTNYNAKNILDGIANMSDADAAAYRENRNGARDQLDKVMKEHFSEAERAYALRQLERRTGTTPEERNNPATQKAAEERLIAGTGDGRQRLRDVETAMADKQLMEKLSKTPDKDLTPDEKKLKSAIESEAAVDKLLKSKVDGGSATNRLRDVETALSNPQLRERLNRPEAQLSEEDKMLKRIIDQTVGDAYMASGNYYPGAQGYSECGGGYDPQASERFEQIKKSAVDALLRDGKLPPDQKLELGFKPADVYEQLKGATDIQRQAALAKMNPQERLIAEQAIKNPDGKLEPVDQLRSMVLRGASSEEIIDAVKKMKADHIKAQEGKDPKEQVVWANQVATMFEQYEQRYGKKPDGTRNTGTLFDDLQSKMAPAEQLQLRQFLTREKQDGRQIFYDANAIREDNQGGANFDGSHDTVDRQIQSFRDALQLNQGTIPPEKLDELTKVFAESIKQYQESKEKAAEIITTAVIMVAAIAATIATGGAASPLLILALGGMGALVKVGGTYLAEGGSFEGSLAKVMKLAVEGFATGALSALGPESFAFLGSTSRTAIPLVSANLGKTLAREGLTQVLKEGAEASSTNLLRQAFADAAAYGRNIDFKSIAAKLINKDEVITFGGKRMLASEAVEQTLKAEFESVTGQVIKEVGKETFLQTASNVIIREGVSNVVVGEAGNIASTPLINLVNGRGFTMDGYGVGWQTLLPIGFAPGMRLAVRGGVWAAKISSPVLEFAQREGTRLQKALDPHYVEFHPAIFAAQYPGVEAKVIDKVTGKEVWHTGQTEPFKFNPEYHALQTADGKPFDGPTPFIRKASTADATGRIIPPEQTGDPEIEILSAKGNRVEARVGKSTITTEDGLPIHVTVGDLEVTQVRTAGGGVEPTSVKVKQGDGFVTYTRDSSGKWVDSQGRAADFENVDVNWVNGSVALSYPPGAAASAKIYHLDGKVDEFAGNKIMRTNVDGTRTEIGTYTSSEARGFDPQGPKLTDAGQPAPAASVRFAENSTSQPVKISEDLSATTRATADGGTVVDTVRVKGEGGQVVEYHLDPASGKYLDAQNKPADFSSVKVNAENGTVTFKYAEGGEITSRVNHANGDAYIFKADGTMQRVARDGAVTEIPPGAQAAVRNIAEAPEAVLPSAQKAALVDSTLTSYKHQTETLPAQYRAELQAKQHELGLTDADIDMRVKAATEYNQRNFARTTSEMDGAIARASGDASAAGDARAALTRSLEDGNKRAELGAALRKDLLDVKVTKDGGGVSDVWAKFEADPKLSVEQKDRIFNVLAESRDYYTNVVPAKMEADLRAKAAAGTLDLTAPIKDANLRAQAESGAITPAEARIQDQVLASRQYQEVNWKHTRGEIDQVLESSRLRPNMTANQVEDAILGSIYSDMVKSPSNFIVHNIDGARAAAENLPRHFDMSVPGNQARVDGIVTAIKEHQIGPPKFMSDMNEMFISGSVRGQLNTNVTALKAANGGTLSATDEAILKGLQDRLNPHFGRIPERPPLTDAEINFLKSAGRANDASNPDKLLNDYKAYLDNINNIKTKIADPLNPLHQTADGSQIKFTDAEKQLLQRIGVYDWTVPNPNSSHYLASRTLLDGDSLINYATPDGWAKIAAIRGPDTPFAGDKTVFDSLASAKSSYDDAYAVMSTEARQLGDKGVELTEQAVARVRTQVNVDGVANDGMEGWLQRTIAQRGEQYGYGDTVNQRIFETPEFKRKLAAAEADARAKGLSDAEVEAAKQAVRASVSKVSFWDPNAIAIKDLKEYGFTDADITARTQLARDIRSKMVDRLRDEQTNWANRDADGRPRVVAPGTPTPGSQTVLPGQRNTPLGAGFYRDASAKAGTSINAAPPISTKATDARTALGEELTGDVKPTIGPQGSAVGQGGPASTAAGAGTGAGHQGPKPNDDMGASGASHQSPQGANPNDPANAAGATDPKSTGNGQPAKDPGSSSGSAQHARDASDRVVDSQSMHPDDVMSAELGQYRLRRPGANGMPDTIAPIGKNELVLGKNGSDVDFGHVRSVDESHARLTWKDGKTYIEDLGSKEGTFIKEPGSNEYKLVAEPTAIKEGTSIRLGGNERAMMVLESRADISAKPKPAAISQPVKVGEPVAMGDEVFVVVHQNADDGRLLVQSRGQTIEGRDINKYDLSKFQKIQQDGLDLYVSKEGLVFVHQPNSPVPFYMDRNYRIVDAADVRPVTSTNVASGPYNNFERVLVGDEGLRGQVVAAHPHGDLIVAIENPPAALTRPAADARTMEAVRINDYAYYRDGQTLYVIVGDRLEASALRVVPTDDTFKMPTPVNYRIGSNVQVEVPHLNGPADAKVVGFHRHGDAVVNIGSAKQPNPQALLAKGNGLHVGSWDPHTGDAIVNGERLQRLRIGGSHRLYVDSSGAVWAAHGDRFLYRDERFAVLPRHEVRLRDELPTPAQFSNRVGDIVSEAPHSPRAIDNSAIAQMRGPQNSLYSGAHLDLVGDRNLNFSSVLDAGELQLGRAHGLTDPKVSANHATVRWDSHEQLYYIEDHSLNGTFIKRQGETTYAQINNGRYYLAPGDEIRLGSIDGPDFRLNLNRSNTPTLRINTSEGWSPAGVEMWFGGKPVKLDIEGKAKLGRADMDFPASGDAFDALNRRVAREHAELSWETVTIDGKPTQSLVIRDLSAAPRATAGDALDLGRTVAQQQPFGGGTWVARPDGTKLHIKGDDIHVYDSDYKYLGQGVQPVVIGPNDIIRLGSVNGPELKLAGSTGHPSVSGNGNVFWRENGNLSLARPDGTTKVMDRTGSARIIDSNGNIVHVTDSNNVPRRYHYDGDNNLRAVQFADGTSAYTRDGINWHTNRNGQETAWWQGKVTVEADGSLRHTRLDGSEARIERLDGSFETIDGRGRTTYHPADLDVERQHLLRLSGDFPQANQARFVQQMEALERRAATQGLAREEVAATFQQVRRLLQTDASAPLPLATRKRLAEEIMFNAAEPRLIDQGGRGTCNVTTVEKRIYAQQPSIAARIVVDMASTGKHITARGVLIDGTRIPGMLYPDAEALSVISVNGYRADNVRNHASALFQVAAVNSKYADPVWAREWSIRENVKLQEGDVVLYENVNPTAGRNENLVLYQDRAGSLETHQIDHQAHMYPDEHERVYEGLTGNAETGFMISGRHMPVDAGYAQGIPPNFGPNSIPRNHVAQDMNDLARQLENLQQGGRLPAIVSVDANNFSPEAFVVLRHFQQHGTLNGLPPFMGGRPVADFLKPGGHVINVQRIYTERNPWKLFRKETYVEFTNQWGSNKNGTIKLSELWQAMGHPLAPGAHPIVPATFKKQGIGATLPSANRQGMGAAPANPMTPPPPLPRHAAGVADGGPRLEAQSSFNAGDRSISGTHQPAGTVLGDVYHDIGMYRGKDSVEGLEGILTDGKIRGFTEKGAQVSQNGGPTNWFESEVTLRINATPDDIPNIGMDTNSPQYANWFGTFGRGTPIDIEGKKLDVIVNGKDPAEIATRLQQVKAAVERANVARVAAGLPPLEVKVKSIADFLNWDRIPEMGRALPVADSHEFVNQLRQSPLSAQKYVGDMAARYTPEQFATHWEKTWPDAYDSVREQIARPRPIGLGADAAQFEHQFAGLSLGEQLAIMDQMRSPRSANLFVAKMMDDLDGGRGLDGTLRDLLKDQKVSRQYPADLPEGEVNLRALESNSRRTEIYEGTLQQADGTESRVVFHSPQEDAVATQTRIANERAAQGLNKEIGFASSYPRSSERTVIIDGKPRDGFVQEHAGTTIDQELVDLAYQRFGRVDHLDEDLPVLFSENPKLRDELAEIVAERLTYGDRDISVKNVVRGTDGKLHNIDMGHAFDGSSLPEDIHTFRITELHSIGLARALEGQPLPDAVRKKLASFATRYGHDEAISRLATELGVPFEQVKGTVVRAQALAESGRFPPASPRLVSADNIEFARVAADYEPTPGLKPGSPTPEVSSTIQPRTTGDGGHVHSDDDHLHMGTLEETHLRELAGPNGRTEIIDEVEASFNQAQKEWGLGYAARAELHDMRIAVVGERVRFAIHMTAVHNIHIEPTEFPDIATLYAMVKHSEESLALLDDLAASINKLNAHAEKVVSGETIMSNALRPVAEKMNVPPPRVVASIDSYGDALGSYSMGRGTINVRTEALDRLDLSPSQIKTLTHELGHLEQDATIIRMLADELDVPAAPSTAQIADLRAAYRKSMGRDLDAKFAADVMALRSGNRLSKTELARAIELRDNFVDALKDADFRQMQADRWQLVKLFDAEDEQHALSLINKKTPDEIKRIFGIETVPPEVQKWVAISQSMDEETWRSAANRGMATEARQELSQYMRDLLTQSAGQHFPTYRSRLHETEAAALGELALRRYPDWESGDEKLLDALFGSKGRAVTPVPALEGRSGPINYENLEMMMGSRGFDPPEISGIIRKLDNPEAILDDLSRLQADLTISDADLMDRILAHLQSKGLNEDEAAKLHVAFMENDITANMIRVARGGDLDLGRLFELDDLADLSPPTPTSRLPQEPIAKRGKQREQLMSDSETLGGHDIFFGGGDAYIAFDRVDQFISAKDARDRTLIWPSEAESIRKLIRQGDNLAADVATRELELIGRRIEATLAIRGEIAVNPRPWKSLEEADRAVFRALVDQAMQSSDEDMWLLVNEASNALKADGLAKVMTADEIKTLLSRLSPDDPASLGHIQAFKSEAEGRLQRRAIEQRVAAERAARNEAARREAARIAKAQRDAALERAMEQPTFDVETRLATSNLTDLEKQQVRRAVVETQQQIDDARSQLIDSLVDELARRGQQFDGNALRDRIAVSDLSPMALRHALSDAKTGSASIVKSLLAGDSAKLPDWLKSSFSSDSNALYRRLIDDMVVSSAIESKAIGSSEYATRVRSLIDENIKAMTNPNARPRIFIDGSLRNQKDNGGKRTLAPINPLDRSACCAAASLAEALNRTGQRTALLNLLDKAKPRSPFAPVNPNGSWHVQYVPVRDGHPLLTSEHVMANFGDMTENAPVRDAGAAKFAAAGVARRGPSASIDPSVNAIYTVSKQFDGANGAIGDHIFVLQVKDRVAQSYDVLTGKLDVYDLDTDLDRVNGLLRLLEKDKLHGQVGFRQITGMPHERVSWQDTTRLAPGTALDADGHVELEAKDLLEHLRKVADDADSNVPTK